VILHLNNGEAQPNLETMREEFPFLAEATEALIDQVHHPIADSQMQLDIALPMNQALRWRQQRKGVRTAYRY